MDEIRLVKQDFNTKLGLHIAYQYQINDDPNWAIFEQIYQKSSNPSFADQNNLSDEEYFNQLNAGQDDLPPNERAYYLLVNDDPVAIFYINDDILNLEINYYTAKSKRNKGYATIGLNLMCRMIFSNPDVEKIKLIIYDINTISPKVAIKNGFNITDQGEYVKYNLNYQLTHSTTTLSPITEYSPTCILKNNFL